MNVDYWLLDSHERDFKFTDIPSPANMAQAIQRVQELAEERKKGGCTGGCEYCLSTNEVLEAIDGER